MEDPSYQKKNEIKYRLKNIFLFLNIAALLFLSFVIFVTSLGERLSFSLEDFVPAILIFLMILLFSFLYLTKEIKNDYPWIF